MPPIKMGRGQIGFTVARSYKTTLEKAWNGATQAKHLKKFFVDKVSSDFAPEVRSVVWEWKGFEQAHLYVTACKPKEFVEFHWKAEGVKYHTSVRLEFARIRGRVLLTITEQGWTNADIKSAFAHCTGWTDFVDYLKAYLIYGLDFRK